MAIEITDKAANTHFTQSCFIYRDKSFTDVNILNRAGKPEKGRNFRGYLNAERLTPNAKRQTIGVKRLNDYNFNTIAKMRRGRSPNLPRNDVYNTIIIINGYRWLIRRFFYPL